IQHPLRPRGGSDRVPRLPALRPGRLGGDRRPRAAARRGGRLAGRRHPAGALLRGDLAPDPALVRRPPRRPLVPGRPAGHGLGAGARGGGGTGRAPGRGLPGARSGAGGDGGGLEPPAGRAGQRPDPAALRPGPVRGAGPGGAGGRGRLAAPRPDWLDTRASPANFRCPPMKADIHPDYRAVVFQDVTSDFKFLTRSTLAASAKETIKWEDGNEYPLIKVEVSSATH